MKKLLVILAVFVAFAASVSAQAPAPTPFSIYAGGALSLPQSDAFKASFKNGYHGFLGLGMKVAPMLQVIGKVEYHTFKFNFDNAAGFDGYTGGTNKMLMYGVDGKLSPSVPASPVKPYFLAGLGFANIKQSEFEGPSSLSLSILNEVVSESQTKLYFNVGAGADLVANPAFSIFAQARYVSISTDGETAAFVPISLGVRFF